MAQELQPLLDQIRTEGIEKAKKEASDIVEHAKEKAARLVREAEEKADKLLVKAEADAVIYTRRSTAALEQAARDLLITVGQGIENIISTLVAESTREAMRIEVLEQMLIKMAQSCAEHHGETRIEMLIGKDDQKELVKFFADKYREKMVHGVELHVDNEILKGFKVSFSEDHVYLDFTQEAIAESLTSFLRPQLAELVSRVAGQTSTESRPAQPEG